MAEGSLYEFRLACYIADAREFANASRKEKEMPMVPFSPEMGAGPRSMPLARWTLGLRMILKLREEQARRVASNTLLWKAPSAERPPSDLRDGFSFQIVSVFLRKGQLEKLLAENFPFSPPSPHSLQLLTFWLKQKGLWKKMRLVLLQVLCFCWNG